MQILHFLWTALSSDGVEHFASVLSSLTTIVVAISGVFIARKWLVQRNLERAHDAADRFFDALIDLPLVQWRFMIDASHCMALLSSGLDCDGESLKQHNQVTIQRCLTLTESANSIKLNFFGHYARASRRGANIQPESHQRVERALIQFCDVSCIQFKELATRLMMVKSRDDYLSAIRDFQDKYNEIATLNTNVSDAVRSVIGISFQEYFSFPDMTTSVRGQR
jgi:hypothetical protein